MKNYIRLFHNPLAGIAAAQGVAASTQVAIGLVQSITGESKMQKALAKRKAFVTPEEVYKIVNATTNRMGGLDPETLSYITGEVDRGFSSSINAATKFGADPNLLSEILDKKIQATFKIGAENQIENMKNFEKYLSAQQLLADNKAAEQKSQQDIIKDELQAAGLNKQAGLQNIIGGVNAGLSAFSSLKTGSLYTQQQNRIGDILSKIEDKSIRDELSSILSSQKILPGVEYNIDGSIKSN